MIQDEYPAEIHLEPNVCQHKTILHMSLSEDAKNIFSQTLDYVSPAKVLPEEVRWNAETGDIKIQGTTISVEPGQPVYIIGFGKASVSMGAAAESIFGSRVKDGIVISPDHHKVHHRFQVFKGSHPLPDLDSLSSSLELVRFMKSIPRGALVLNLVSGGTSSLFCVPAGNLEVDEVRDIYELLIESGASIHEINTVRKVFSSVKGGQILDSLRHTILIDLMISDIPDDNKSMIGSGPSVAQTISATSAFQVLKKYEIYQQIPHAARQLLAVEMDKEARNNAYRTTQDFENHYSFIISSASKLADRAAQIADGFGYTPRLAKEPWDGPIDDLEEMLSKKIDNLPDDWRSKYAIITFGEPTVHVTGSGLGGRNQELALRMAARLKQHKKEICFLSAGTDGIDGPTDAAGAVVTNKTYSEAEEAGIDPMQYLRENDSYHFFEKAGGHIKPGPTGNNLMDLQITLVG